MSWRILAIVSVLGAVFTPTIFGEFITADDTIFVEYLRQSGTPDFYDLFFGSHARMFYYRPVLMSTYYLDVILWDLHPYVMRFENICIHIASTLLVYLILKKLISRINRNWSSLVLGGALLFGLNPIVTESVNWVSGRSDLLAGLFVLLSALFILKFKQGEHWTFLIAAVGAGILGSLCKEVAFAFAPGALLILSSGQDLSIKGRLSAAWLRPLALVIVAICSVGLFFYLRTFAILASASNLTKTLSFIFNDPMYSCLVAFRLLGFYVKKIFFPWPLNFAILSVDPVYELLGMVLAIVCAWSLFSKKYAASFFLAGVFLIAPAFPIAFNHIAWTPYAERYVYVASGMIAIASILFINDRIKNHTGYRWIIVLIVMVNVVFAASTWQRNKVWQLNESLWYDTINKSPNFPLAYSEYGLILMDRGEFAEAIKYFKIAVSYPNHTLRYRENLDANLAVAYEKSGDFFAAEETYRLMLKRTKDRSAVALMGLVKLYQNELKRKHPSLEKNELVELLQDSRTRLAELSHTVSVQ